LLPNPLANVLEREELQSLSLLKLSEFDVIELLPGLTRQNMESDLGDMMDMSG
jgi:hypothetical protein